MYSGAGKSRGGGGRGGSVGKSNIRTTFQRSSPAPPTNRLSIGGGGGGAPSRNRCSLPSGASTSSNDTKEESFRLVRGSELNYAMIIRLAPDLVEEIKRVEAQGGEPKIKFDANANNPAGNVINVGGKDFRFTWSHEPGDLCDIYEERKSAEDCTGTLVESGSAWRKLNVQRVLDESTKNHVKMRSEEAERKLKSRKAIVLDPGNPSMKNQMKALAAAETNPWRMPYKQKKEPPLKKRIPEPPSGPPKSMYKSGLLTTPTKGRHSTSPLTSPPQQPVAPASPFPNSNNNNKGRLSMENIFGYEAINKSNSSEKDLPSKMKNSAGLDKRGRKLKVENSPDLRSMLVSLLKENPSGMSFKALEKAVGDAFPNSVKQIEPIIKKIATYHAPGKYLLRPEVDMESSKKSSPIDGSSLLDNRNQSSPQPPAPGSDFSMRPDGNDMEEMQKIGSKPEESPNDFDKIDIEHESPDIFTDKRFSDSEIKISDGERPVASSSDSGSDSDSESDSHNSGSRSRSKSRSPVGSGSGSSSDSESDASSNSKEASDEDVDIMSSDDDKEKNKELQSSEPGELKSPFEWKPTDLEPVSILTDDKQDDHVLDVVDIEKDLLEDDQFGHMAGATSSPSNKGSQRAEETKRHPPGLNGPREDHSFAGAASRERENEVEGDDSKLRLSNHSGSVPKNKSKRRLEDEKYHNGEHDRSKRLKAVNLNEPLVDITGNSPTVDVPHDPFTEEILNIKKTKTGREGSVDDVIHKSYNQDTYGKSSSDIQQLARKSKVTAATERAGKHDEIIERGVQREKVNRERQDDGGLINDKRLAKFPREAAVDKQTMPVYSHYKEQDMLDNMKEAASVTNEQMDHRFKDGNLNHVQRSPAENGRSLRREPPDLEVGELRTKDSSAYKKRFERNGSFKKSENKPTSSEYWNSDINKGKSSGRVSLESRNTPIPKAAIQISGILEGSKRRSPDHYANDSTSHHHITGQPGVNSLDPISLSNKIVEVNNSNIESDAVTGLGSASSMKQQDYRRSGIPPSSREKRKHQPNNSGNLHDKRKDPSRTESNNGSQKRRESSSDENSCPYSKYEREEPDLKGPIKGVSQYEEYVREYVEKHDSYMSLNKILESYRNEFSQVAKDLEAAEGRDTARYHDLVAQLHESYRQCGAKVKRLKKIFIVLHEELKCLKQMMKDFAASYAKD
ncbi:hypothetical protein Leryth_003127 [Lithospermum erythrorhizon]|nr:hypothetical protein Leryth_003127 [Lithospermum erythrorhizon]